MKGSERNGARMVLLLALALASFLFISSASATSTGTTIYFSILGDYRVNLSSPSPQIVNNNSVAVFTFTVTNNGTATDSYNLSIDNIDNIGSAILNQTTTPTLAPGESFNLTLRLSDPVPANYTVQVIAQSNNNPTTNATTDMDVTIYPELKIIDVETIPYAVINSTNTTIYINADGFESVWAVITVPNNTEITVPLTDEGYVDFTDTIQLGRYNITFYANNSYGELVNYTDYFEVFPGVLIDLDVIDYNLTGIESTFISYYRNGSVAINSSSVGKYLIELANTSLDLEFYAHNNRIRVKTYNIPINEVHNKDIGIDKHNRIADFLITYGIHPEWNVTNASLRIFYDDLNYTNESLLKLYRCAEYDFTGRTCNGNWVDVTGDAWQDLAGDYFNIDVTGFSGYSIREGLLPAPYVPPTGGGGGGGGGSIEDTCIEDWVCGLWSDCFNGFRSRECFDRNTCDNDYAKPITSFACPPIKCKPEWECSEWTGCANGFKNRICKNTNNCTGRYPPIQSDTCKAPEKVIEPGFDENSCFMCDKKIRTFESKQANILCLLLPILAVLLFIMILLMKAYKTEHKTREVLGVINIVIISIIVYMMIPFYFWPYGLCMYIANQLSLIREILLFLAVSYAIVLSEAILSLKHKKSEIKHKEPNKKFRLALQIFVYAGLLILNLLALYNFPSATFGIKILITALFAVLIAGAWLMVQVENKHNAELKKKEQLSSNGHHQTFNSQQKKTKDNKENK